MSDESGNDGATAQAPEAPAVQQQTQEASQQSGIQKRIDELTAKYHEAEGRANAMAQALAAQAAAGAAQAQAPQPPVDEVAQQLQQLEQYSPEVAKAVRAIADSIAAKSQKQLQQVQFQLESQTVSKEVVREAAAMGIKDAKVAARAEELAVSWRANGLRLSPSDALTFALGEAARTPAQARASDGRYAPPDAVITAASPTRTPVQKGGPAPANFESLPADQQLAWFDANGIGDKPF